MARWNRFSRVMKLALEAAAT